MTVIVEISVSIKNESLCTFNTHIKRNITTLKKQTLNSGRTCQVNSITLHRELNIRKVGTDAFEKLRIAMLEGNGEGKTFRECNKCRGP